MSDDLHTSTILNATLLEALRLINSSVERLKKNLQKKQQLSAIQSLIKLEREVRAVLDVLGLLSKYTYSEVLSQLKEKALMRAGLTEDDILIKIEERAQARKAQEWGESDKIRIKLGALGIALMDVGKETIWRPCVPIQEENPVDPIQQEHADVPCVSTDKEQQPTHGSS